VNLLIVDDQTIDRVVLKRLLSRFPECNVHEAADGEVALSKLEIQPALIFCDLSMPKMDGVQFMTHLRSNPFYEHIPVIITSAGKDRDVLLQLKDLGIEDYLLKPYELRSTFDRLERLLKPMIAKHQEAEKARLAAEREAKAAADVAATEPPAASAEPTQHPAPGPAPESTPEPAESQA
jgi:CheY-like chemotaxis protein